MTFKEKLQQEHPNALKANYTGGCCGCPGDYGYEHHLACGDGILGSQCKECWDREIPGTEPTPKFGKWISVEERLPELNKRVLTCRRKVLINLEFRTELNFTYDSLYEPVEFWMPLPPTPEVGE